MRNILTTENKMHAKIFGINKNKNQGNYLEITLPSFPVDFVWKEIMSD